MNNSEIFQSIQTANNIISHYCQDGLYDKTNINQELYQKITNLKMFLYNNALRIMQGQKSLLPNKDEKETLKQINVIMQKICKIITQIYFPCEVEDNIKKLIQDSPFNLNEFFVSNPTENEIKLQTQKILEGI